MGTWTLIVLQGPDRTKMSFPNFDELSRYMTEYRGNYSEDTRFVLHNDGWPDIEIYMAQHKAVYDKEPLPAVLQN